MNTRFRILIAVCCLQHPACPIFAQTTDSTINLLQSAKVDYHRFQLDSANGQWRRAVSWLAKCRRLIDSAADLQHQQQVTQLENTLDVRKKNREVIFNAEHIALLSKETALQNMALKNEEMTRKLVFGGVAILLLLLGIIYNRYRLKIRTNRAVQDRQREISRYNDALEQLVGERVWLLKEMHTRVRNNLQMVISLLDAQVAGIKNESAAMIIRDSKHRMNAISIIHNRLFGTVDLAGIDMAGYLGELSGFLEDSFGTAGRIDFEVSLQPLTLNVSQAIPVGLIVNEAITNAIKYAFPSRQIGVISLTLKSLPDGAVMLAVSDNGVGLREWFDISTSNSLGVSLMQGLAGQIKGKLTFINQNGLTLELTFKKWDF